MKDWTLHNDLHCCQSLCQFPKSHPGKICLCQFPKSEVKIISGDFEPSQIELHPIRNNNSILVLEFKVVNFWYDCLCKLYGQTLTTRQLFVTKSMVWLEDLHCCQSLCQFPKSHPGKVCLCQFPKSEVKLISGDFEPSQIELHPIRNNNSILVLEFKVINFWYDCLCKLYGQTLTTRQLFVTKSMVWLEDIKLYFW